MLLSETSPEIEAAPERLFSFFEAMASNYALWHRDHLLFQWIDPPVLKPGTRFYFEERVAGKRLKKTVKFTRVLPPHLIEFAPTSVLFRVFLPRIEFRIETGVGGFRVTQNIHLRVGPLAAWINRRELAAIRQHMREECQNMKYLIERVEQ